MMIIFKSIFIIDIYVTDENLISFFNSWFEAVIALFFPLPLYIFNSSVSERIFVIVNHHGSFMIAKYRLLKFNMDLY
jgi:hypothetical protein